MFEDFEWDPEMVPGIKLGFHIFQILFAFVCWCLEISVFRADGSVVNGQNGWVFGVVRREGLASLVILEEHPPRS